MPCNEQLLDLTKIEGVTAFVPWVQGTYLMAARTSALDHLPSGADPGDLTYAQLTDGPGPSTRPPGAAPSGSQCDTPMEVDDRPRTRFVGEFIGTPPMVFLRARPTERGRVRVGDTELDAPHRRPAVAPPRPGTGRLVRPDSGGRLTR